MSKTPRPTYTKWFWKDLIAKTQGMSTEAFGAYIRILGYMVTVSEDFCSAPDDEAVLARVSGLGIKAWRRVRPEVVARFELSSTCRLSCQRLRDDADVWAYHCDMQRLRRTGGQPAVNPRSTGTRPDDDHTRSREMPDKRKSLESVASDSTISDNGKNPPPVGGKGPVANAPESLTSKDTTK